MNGFRERTHMEIKVTLIVEVIPHVTQIGAICEGVKRPMVGTTLGDITLDATLSSKP